MLWSGFAVRWNREIVKLIVQVFRRDFALWVVYHIPRFSNAFLGTGAARSEYCPILFPLRCLIQERFMLECFVFPLDYSVRHKDCVFRLTLPRSYAAIAAAYTLLDSPRRSTSLQARASRNLWPPVRIVHRSWFQRSAAASMGPLSACRASSSIFIGPREPPLLATPCRYRCCHCRQLSCRSHLTPLVVDLPLLA